MSPRKWSKERIVDAIHALKDSGIPRNDIYKQDNKLVWAAQNYFGSWSKAMEAAGFEVIPRKNWTKERVIKELRAWYETDIPITVVGGEFRGLYDAAGTYFGSVAVALEAAGLEPKQQGRWTNSRVVQEIQDMYAKGTPVKRRAGINTKLTGAATRHFGNWSNALEAAGILQSDEKPKRRKKWTKDKIIKAIRDRHRRELPMAYVLKYDSSLAAAANYHFGGWQNAMLAAGFEPKYKSWSKEKIIECIKKNYQEGLSLASVWGEDTSLCNAARLHFGSRHNALIAAGLAIEKSRPKRRTQWSKQRIVDEIQNRHRRGLSLSSHEPDNRLLFAAAKKYFGGWCKALATAGVERK